MDEEKKTRLLYSGELLVFSVLFLVLGILIILRIIPILDWKRYAFTYVTLVGGFLLYGDFIWLLCSKKRRAKTAVLDKVLLLPSTTFLICYDLYSIITSDIAILPYVMGGVLCYLALLYIFEGIYYWFHLHPALKYALEEDKKALEAKAKEEESSLLAPQEKEEKLDGQEENH